MTDLVMQWSGDVSRRGMYACERSSIIPPNKEHYPPLSFPPAAWGEQRAALFLLGRSPVVLQVSVCQKAVRCAFWLLKKCIKEDVFFSLPCC